MRLVSGKGMVMIAVEKVRAPGRVCAAPKRLCTIHLHSGFISQELASILLDSNQVCAATQIIKDLAPFLIHFKDISNNIALNLCLKMKINRNIGEQYLTLSYLPVFLHQTK